jgi:hypothetical protein
MNIKQQRKHFELTQIELAEMIHNELKEMNSQRNSNQKRISDLERLNPIQLNDSLYKSESEAINKVFNTLQKG